MFALVNQAKAKHDAIKNLSHNSPFDSEGLGYEPEPGCVNVIHENSPMTESIYDQLRKDWA